MLLYVALIGVKRLFQAAVVGDVLALRVDAVDVEAVFRQCVVAVLINDALLSLLELTFRLRLPPVAIDAVLVELAADVVEAVCDFVSHHVADCAVVKIAANKKLQIITIK